MTDLQTTKLEDFTPENATSAGNGMDYMFHGVGVSLIAKVLFYVTRFFVFLDT
jgi:hypothetical protein